MFSVFQAAPFQWPRPDIKLTETEQTLTRGPDFENNENMANSDRH